MEMDIVVDAVVDIVGDIGMEGNLSKEKRREKIDFKSFGKIKWNILPLFGGG